MYQTRIQTFLRSALPQLLWLVLILLFARWVMLNIFVEDNQLLGKGEDLQRMWSTGIRYDFRVAGLFTSVLFLISLVAATHRVSWRGWSLFLTGIWPFLGAGFALSAISNVYYYQTYHNHFDLFVFALAEDDTLSVLGNIYDDYPVFRILLLAFCGGVFSWCLLKASERIRLPKKWHWSVFAFYLIVITLILAVLARGSVGTFPLRENDSHVSDLHVINKLTPNGLMALSWALASKREDLSFAAVKQSQGVALQQTLGLTSLTERTPKNDWLAQHPPHVVMTLMESFGANMLNLDDAKENDLLGSLRSSFASDFVFKRFVSEQNGTAPSFAALFFQSPMENISQSSAQNEKLDLIPFDVYRNAGYRVVFVSPGNMAWRNLSGYLPRQGVFEVYDQSSLMNLYPEAAAEMTAWGLPDDYAYRFSTDLLAKSDQPLFLVILTVTNHPPYVTPARYQTKPVAITPAVEKHIIEGDIGMDNMLTTFQYAANAFGDFVNGIKQSNLADKTLIAATGDHQMRRLQAYYPEEQVLDRAVPFYLYAPKPILDQVEWHYDANRIGSHKDIFPTLYHLSLSDTQYRSLAGRNMLAVQDDEARAFGYNATLWIDQRGAYSLDSHPLLHEWQDQQSLQVQAQAIEPDSQQLEKLSALPKLLNWQINARIKGVLPE